MAEKKQRRERRSIAGALYQSPSGLYYVLTPRGEMIEISEADYRLRIAQAETLTDESRVKYLEI